MIVPRAHIPHVWELSDDAAEHIGLLISRLSRILMETSGAEGLNVIQSNGEVATEGVNHVHIHLVPRWSQDAIGRIWRPETNYSEHAKDEIWEELRAACRGLRL